MANRESPAQAAPGSAPVKTGLPSTDRRQLAGSVGKGLHKLTEQQYEDLAEAIDELAERIRALDSPAPGSFRCSANDGVNASEAAVGER